MEAGVLLINKPAGLSSAQVISKVKRKLSIGKIGHAGTLDPMATGLLVCLIGRATRLASFAEFGRKIYSGTIKLGIETDSDDITGNIIRELPVEVTDDEIGLAIKTLTGEISQIPPKVSAIKINGDRAYDLSRKGVEFELKSRQVTIDRFEFSRLDQSTINYRVECSKGTYIRSLARDLGQKLGCGGTLSTICREGSAPFGLTDAVTIEQAQENHILPWWHLFEGNPRISVTPAESRRLSHGDKACVGAIFERKELKEHQFAEKPRSGVPSAIVYQEQSSKNAIGIFVWNGSGYEIGLHVTDS